MAGDVVIHAEGLGKLYRIGRKDAGPHYTALRDVMVEAARTAGQRLRNMGGASTCVADPVETFWALKDLNLEIRQGEVVGIVGRNGAGKSTLLKILARITEPTQGRVSIRGRVASLLEVGTGFHPELTGRENIFLNGAILGMSRGETRRKFDQIVSFAEVEAFLDTPVKRYSSGMYTRLAFAVAAHLDPEILIVDEVLAVGDAKFQKKSQQRLLEVSKTGQTVLFVSHNLTAVSTLCTTGVLLRGGRLAGRGTARSVLADYAADEAPSSSFQRPRRSGAKVTLTGGSVACVDPPDGCGPMLDLRLSLTTTQIMRVSVDLRVKDALGTPVGFGTVGACNPRELIVLEVGENPLVFRVGARGLANGRYSLSVDVAEPLVQMFDQVEDALIVEVEAVSQRDSLRRLDQAWGYGSTLFEMSLAGSAPADALSGASRYRR